MIDNKTAKIINSGENANISDAQVSKSRKNSRERNEDKRYEKEPKEKKIKEEISQTKSRLQAPKGSKKEQVSVQTSSKNMYSVGSLKHVRRPSTLEQLENKKKDNFKSNPSAPIKKPDSEWGKLDEFENNNDPQEFDKNQTWPKRKKKVVKVINMVAINRGIWEGGTDKKLEDKNEKPLPKRTCVKSLMTIWEPMPQNPLPKPKEPPPPPPPIPEKQKSPTPVKQKSPSPVKIVIQPPPPPPKPKSKPVSEIYQSIYESGSRKKRARDPEPISPPPILPKEDISVTPMVFSDNRVNLVKEVRFGVIGDLYRGYAKNNIDSVRQRSASDASMIHGHVHVDREWPEGWSQSQRKLSCGTGELLGQWRERLTQQLAVETPGIQVGIQAKAAAAASSVDDLKCASLLRRKKTLEESLSIERPKSGHLDRPSTPKLSVNDLSKKWNSSLGGEVQDWRRGLTRTRSLMHTRRPSASVWS